MRRLSAGREIPTRKVRDVNYVATSYGRLLRRRRAYRRTTDASRKLVSRDVDATSKLA